MGDAIFTRRFSVTISPLGTQENPAISAQAIFDENPSAANGVYYINLPTVGVTEVYCEFKNNEGWMLVGNIKSDYYGDVNWTWDDFTSWRREGNDFGNTNLPYTTTGHYRTKDVYSYKKTDKLLIKVHNNGNEFGSGSWVAFQLTPTHTNKSFLELMTSGGGSGGGIQISNAWYAQQGMATGGSNGATTGFATSLDYCPIARSLGASGHLRVNHHLDNNGVRLLTSFQTLETTNTDRTRGLGIHMCMPGGIEGQTISGCNYNGTWHAWVNGSGTSPFATGQYQYGTGTYPNNTNSSARDLRSPYTGTPYHYGLFVK
jgi:hypothetical protein